ncbi:MAG: hypothetical protein R3F31_01480 [Verrucomicrobiales bacterium]
MTMRPLVLATLLLTGTGPWIPSAFPVEPMGGFESNCGRDPTRAHDLADDAALAGVKARLSAELDAWLQSHGDPGIAQDTKEAHQAAKAGAHLFGPPP